MKRGVLTAVLVIRLSKEAMDELREIATDKGLNLSTLARMWLMEKLHENLKEK